MRSGINTWIDIGIMLIIRIYIFNGQFKKKKLNYKHSFVDSLAHIGLLMAACIEGFVFDPICL
jgi:exonuclease III